MTSSASADSFCFEGPEKLLEIWFAPSEAELPAPAAVDAEDGVRRRPQRDGEEWKGLRQVPRQVWEDMLDIVQCKVLSFVEGDETDAYLLSCVPVDGMAALVFLPSSTNVSTYSLAQRVVAVHLLEPANPEDVRNNAQPARPPAHPLGRQDVCRPRLRLPVLLLAQELHVSRAPDRATRLGLGGRGRVPRRYLWCVLCPKQVKAGHVWNSSASYCRMLSVSSDAFVSHADCLRFLQTMALLIRLARLTATTGSCTSPRRATRLAPRLPRLGPCRPQSRPSRQRRVARLRGRPSPRRPTTPPRLRSSRTPLPLPPFISRSRSPRPRPHGPTRPRPTELSAWSTAGRHTMRRPSRRSSVRSGCRRLARSAYSARPRAATRRSNSS